MPSSRASDRISASLSELGEARALVAVLCAHLLALSEEREIRLPLSSSERDIVARAAAVPEDEARRIAGDMSREGPIGAARSYLARRFEGTTLLEKGPAAGLGLSDSDAEMLAHVLMYREAFLAALESSDERSARELQARALPIRLREPEALLFAFPKVNADRFLTRLTASFSDEREPLRLVRLEDAELEESYASILASFALVADRRKGRNAALSAALLRHLSGEFVRTPQDAARVLRSAVEDALIAFCEPDKAVLDITASEELFAYRDAVVAVALREGDAGGAVRIASLSVASREDVRDAAKSLIIPEEAKRALLAFLDKS